MNLLWRNLVCRCGQFLARDRGFQDLAGNFVTAGDPGFADEKRLDFRLMRPLCLDRAGLRPVPFGEIGLYPDKVHAPHR